jgi:hypothetical protein
MTVLKDIAHSSAPARWHFPPTWIRRAVDWVASLLQSARRQALYWQGLLGDVCTSQEFPATRLVFSMGVAILGLAVAMWSVDWVVPGAVEPRSAPVMAVVLAWTCIAFCLASFVAVLLLFGELLFPRSEGRGRYAIERLSRNVREFRIVYDGLVEDKKRARLGPGNSRLREFAEELGIHVNRYRTIKRAQFVLVVFSGILSSIVLFAALYLADFNLELRFWGKVPKFEFRDLQGGHLHQLLSGFHTSVAMFGTMGVGYVDCPLIKLISIMEVLFAGLVVFFGMNMALAFQQEAMDLPLNEVMHTIKSQINTPPGAPSAT